MAFFCLLSLMVSPLFAINDDMMIESVLSGSYLRPYPYSYYFSAELGYLLSGLYSLVPALPWLGLFYFGCHVSCIASLIRLAWERFDDLRLRLGAVLIAFLGMIAFCFQEFVLMHYTVLAALLGATGLFLFLVAKEKTQFTRPIVYFLLCYLVRENVFFMLAPMIAIAFFYLLVKNGFENWKAYLPRGIVFGMLFIALFTLNRGALSGKAWEEYLTYNDVRTQGFDYLGIHSEEAALAEYAKEGVTESDVALISSYDLALFDDGTGNLKALKAVESYGKVARQSAGERLVWALKTYVHRFFFQKDDLPLNLIVLICYIGLLIYYIMKKKFLAMIPLVGLGAYRSAFWCFLLYGGRYPDRVILSLFLMELAFLMAMILREIRENINENADKATGVSRWQLKGVVLVMTLLLLGTAIWNVQDTRKLYRDQVAINRGDDLLISYMREHPEQFYFLDVYTVVGRTKPAFEATGNKKENYLWMGGWMTRHPLYLEKLSTFNGSDNAKDALLSSDNSYLVIKEGVGASKESLESWIGEELRLADTIEGESVRFLIFEVMK
ncbi:MAG: hypothetical protein J6Z22_07770 [Lachnospiraceae bacterium]|nr:hypothetical protein [Lachnospiraceae bacterium]